MIAGSTSKNVIADDVKLMEETREEPDIQEEYISTSTDEAKTTPNTVLIIKKYYKDCNHAKTEKKAISSEMVNLGKEEFIKKYPNFEVEEFSKEKVSLKTEVDSFCGEHYLLIAEEGNVNIYRLDEEGSKNLEQTTEIAYEYLPETDKIILNNRDLHLWSRRIK